MRFGSRELVEREAADLAADARAALGHDAVNDAKKIISTRFDTILGWRCNTVAFTIAPSPRAVLKLLYVFNVATPPSLAIGSPVKARHLLRLSSLATWSREIVPLRPFSASLGRTAGGTLVNKAAVRHLTGAALTDIIAWRTTLQAAVHNPRVLEVLARWLSLANVATDVQVAAADVQVWADSHGNGGIGTSWESCGTSTALRRRHISPTGS